jgi:hypothetical protein
MLGWSGVAASPPKAGERQRADAFEWLRHLAADPNQPISAFPIFYPRPFIVPVGRLQLGFERRFFSDMQVHF